MIYTSYFAKARKIQDKSKLVCIARFAPKGTDMAMAPELMPPKEVLFRYKKDGDMIAYTESYTQDVLSKLDPAEIAKKYQNKILLCYERPEAFCHRHLIAAWLNSNGYDCKELEL